MFNLMDVRWIYNKQAYMYCIFFLKYNFESGKCFGIFEEKKYNESEIILLSGPVWLHSVSVHLQYHYNFCFVFVFVWKVLYAYEINLKDIHI